MNTAEKLGYTYYWTLRKALLKYSKHLKYCPYHEDPKAILSTERNDDEYTTYKTADGREVVLLNCTCGLRDIISQTSITNER